MVKFTRAGHDEAMQQVGPSHSFTVRSSPATLLLPPIFPDCGAALPGFAADELRETGEVEVWMSCPLDDQEPTGPENEPGGFFQTHSLEFREVRKNVFFQTTGIPTQAANHGGDGEKLAAIDSYWHGGLNE
jgi:hypothetical protein